MGKRGRLRRPKTEKKCVRLKSDQVKIFSDHTNEQGEISKDSQGKNSSKV